MQLNQRIWRVGQSPERLSEARLASERQLEEMIVAKPEIVSDQWMIIGQQEDTGFNGRIDLLAIAPDSSLILIELKRGQSPREVVAHGRPPSIGCSVRFQSMTRSELTGRDTSTWERQRYLAHLIEVSYPVIS